MTTGGFNLAIETSGRAGSVTLGRAGRPLASADLPAQRRHVIGLMPTIDQLCRDHGAGPGDLQTLYVSVGPGSFTGLRVGVTVAKILARAKGCRVVAVPTLDAVVENAPTDRPHVAVMLTAKGGRCFTAVFARTDRQWKRDGEATLMTPAELCERAPRPLAVIGDKLPEHDWPGGVERLDAELAQPHSDVIWRLGQTLADADAFADPYALTPLYIRLPDAEEKWRAKEAAE